MNALVVVNIGNYMSTNANNSIRFAAKRWETDYLEVTSIYPEYLHPAFAKSLVGLRLQQFDRIAVFDADMLIKWNAPNCFNLFTEENKFYAVKDISEQRSYVPKELHYDISDWVRNPYFSKLANDIPSEISKEQYFNNFFNSGFFLCSPDHFYHFFKFLESNLPSKGDPYSRNPHYEQAWFNYCMQLLTPEKLVHVDETWNYIDPDISVKHMQKNVYHFTGANYKTLKKEIEIFPWTA